MKRAGIEARVAIVIIWRGHDRQIFTTFDENKANEIFDIAVANGLTAQRSVQIVDSPDIERVTRHFAGERERAPGGQPRLGYTED